MLVSTGCLKVKLRSVYIKKNHIREKATDKLKTENKKTWISSNYPKQLMKSGKQKCWTFNHCSDKATQQSCCTFVAVTSENCIVMLFLKRKKKILGIFFKFILFFLSLIYIYLLLKIIAPYQYHTSCVVHDSFKMYIRSNCIYEFIFMTFLSSKHC